MRTFVRVISFAALLAGVFGASASADTVYSYVGDKFMYATGVYAQGDQVTGSFVLSDSFVPELATGNQSVTSGVTSYSFTDGHQTLTQSNSTATFTIPFRCDSTTCVTAVPGADNSGDSFWSVKITTPTSGIFTEFVGDYFIEAWIGGSEPSATSMAVINGLGPADIYGGSRGTWTVQTPEGGTTALFLFAGLTILTPFIGLKSYSRRL